MRRMTLLVWGEMIGLLLLVLFGASAAAQQNKALDFPFGESPASIGELAGAAFDFGILLIVFAAAVFLAIGAYYYFAAAGNAQLAAEGKAIMSRAIFGLILGLIAWILIKTISPQFVELKPPTAL